ncbi:hypothetical protein J421_4390 [Gemmatirosa kalamazoonensis]|uniref:Outer membrane protein beta-barrel domain-containing protein n=1 Tax=Gemmatirosa kalamazoonensis TaxID=861299 RepID=W0RN52_9BACT|nr:hypothetical protein [Gemmatirosa kalamazoonensis]AHG91927.1 hypothetical protein J421_4390 [Gemmatirosa kalamazoonensis]
MTLRFSTSRAIGAAIALTLGSVSAAGAQQMPVRKDTPRPSSTPMPVTKDTPAPRDTTSSMPAPAPAPAPAPTPTPAPVAVDTTTTTTTTTTTVSTGEVPAPAPAIRLRNGWYIGVAGAGEIPKTNFSTFYKSGWGVEVPVGWDSPNGPLGIRANFGYATLKSKSGLPVSVAEPQIWQAVADAKLRLPFGHGLLSGLYGVAGGGAYHFRNYGRTPTVSSTTTNGTMYTTTFNNLYDTGSSSSTKLGWNAGGGIQFGIGSAALYAESRYVSVNMNSGHSAYIPVALGLTFNW